MFAKVYTCACVLWVVFVQFLLVSPITPRLPLTTMAVLSQPTDAGWEYLYSMCYRKLIKRIKKLINEIPSPGRSVALDRTTLWHGKCLLLVRSGSDKTTYLRYHSSVRWRCRTAMLTARISPTGSVLMTKWSVSESAAALVVRAKPNRSASSSSSSRRRSNLWGAVRPRVPSHQRWSKQFTYCSQEGSDTGAAFVSLCYFTLLTFMSMFVPF